MQTQYLLGKLTPTAQVPVSHAQCSQARRFLTHQQALTVQVTTAFLDQWLRQQPTPMQALLKSPDPRLLLQTK